ncbi:hypothetical protein DSOL_0986 [Desulfosporosinus metallidurans]|uniref:Uncharacterized protein n=1 Tax=Desulfosporosinus metallidurans TaxID=1888891 RepID=A0A1Q8R0V4_9FIRM|nr:hypothetical protein DSOL_0986 [Desulfosporosinus metallidurans]
MKQNVSRRRHRGARGTEAEEPSPCFRETKCFTEKAQGSAGTEAEEPSLCFLKFRQEIFKVT